IFFGHVRLDRVDGLTERHRVRAGHLHFELIEWYVQVLGNVQRRNELPFVFETARSSLQILASGKHTRDLRLQRRVSLDARLKLHLTAIVWSFGARLRLVVTEFPVVINTMRRRDAALALSKTGGTHRWNKAQYER